MPTFPKIFGSWKAINTTKNKQAVMTEESKPRKTLKITRKRSGATNTPATEESSATTHQRKGKRVLTFDKPAKKQPQPPAKKKRCRCNC